MIDWFEWNGERSTTDYGVTVLTQPSIIMPSERVEYVEVPGKSGSLTKLQAKQVLDDITPSCVCILDDPYELVNNVSVDRIAKISSWLRGAGRVIFANRPHGYYQARVSSQIPIDKVLRGNPHVSFSIPFRCKPYLYLLEGDETTTISKNTSRLLTNPGNTESKPLLKIVGTSEGTIMCGDLSLFVDDFSGINYIMVDCEARIAYQGTRGDPSDPLVLLNTRISGDWLSIPTGDSFFTVTGGITSVVLTPRWRDS